MFLKGNDGRSSDGERQIRPLHSDRAIEIGVRPDIDRWLLTNDKKEEPGDRAGVMAAARQAAQLCQLQVAKSISIKKMTGTLINISCQSRAISFWSGLMTSSPDDRV